jgi:surface antigen
MKDVCVVGKWTTKNAGLILIVAFLSAFVVSGCETISHGQQGEILGGVIGGVVGSQVGDGRGKTAAIIVGSIGGAMIGRRMGESMDDTDRMQAAAALNDTRTGEAASWINPDSGYRYSVTPTRTYEERSGPCREFSLNATIGNQPNPDVYGIACLQADGSWLVQ